MLLVLASGCTVSSTQPIEAITPTSTASVVQETTATPPPVPPAGAASPGIATTGLTPTQAVAAMKLADGFRVELVAAEPDLHQPVALAVDARGRLWVAEAMQYPVRAITPEGKDDIIVFEDRDGDGERETRTVFQSGLNLVSGLEVGYGGVWVGAAPNLLFIPDADGDLRPDGPPVVELDGWSFEDTQETLNSFRFGPDGWLYGCQGVYSHSRVGRPGTAPDDRAPMDAGVWRFDPRTQRFEVFAWGTSNPWGLDFDAAGRCVITACVIPHLWHVVQGGRYQRQIGAHFDAHAYEEIETIADHHHFSATDPHGNNLTSDEAGGGHVHSGALVALGDTFPQTWRDVVLMGNLHGNRILGDRLEARASGLLGRHVGDWLAANDRWFRPIALREGSDGAVYLIDWYDSEACHLTTPESFDRTNGRLYRVSFGEHAAARIDFASADGAALVNALASPNEWTARQALQRLHERGPDPALSGWCESLVSSGASKTLRLRALWALRAAGGFDEERGRRFLASTDADVVAWSVQLLLEDRDVTPATLEALVGLARNTRSPKVLLYLASALQRLPVAQRWDLARALLARAEDESDPNIPAVLWYGVEPLVAADPARALQLARHAAIERTARLLVRRAAADAALHATFVRELADPENSARRAMLLDEFVRGMGAQRRLPMPAGWTELAATLARDPAPEVRRSTARLAALFGDASAFAEQRRILTDASADKEARGSALDALSRGQDPELCTILRDLLRTREMRGDALRALAACDEGGIPGDVLKLWTELDGSERRDALNLLASRREWAGRLIFGISSGQIARTDVSAFVARRIESLGDELLTNRLQEVWGNLRETSAERLQRIEQLTAQLTPESLQQADVPAGREVFSRTCEQCHTLFDRGGSVGPDLTGANRRDLTYLLSNIVDPSGVVAKDYWTTIVGLDDGRLVTGVPVASTDSSITLRTENEDVVIDRAEIEESRVIESSLMPEGLLDRLTPEETRDLIAYLQGPTQAPQLATASNAATLFAERSLAGARPVGSFVAREGEIVGRTDPATPRAVLASELEVRDFLLRFEIRCDSSADASVWFRERSAQAGERSGFRVRFSESARGRTELADGTLLAAGSSATAPVSSGGWVRCEIEARGGRIRIAIDGRPHADFEVAAGPRAGSIALDLASAAPAELHLRSWKLEVLEPASRPR